MIPELGHFAIILALCFAIMQIASPFIIKKTQSLVQPIAAFSQFIFLSLALLCLIIAFIQNDLTVIYVRDHSHHLLPFIYRVGAAWGGHEGSLLLWCLILSAWTVAFILFSDKNLSKSFSEKIIMVLGFISTGFILFLLTTSNPFKREFPTTPIVGNDLTPVLQDPGLIFHPPMLYLGYVGFAIGFAFAIAALLEGKFEKEWARACRPWIILPWACLSCGIVLGSWWAYRELGWGGWWFWDPVENASLLPWLAATALIHSLIVSEKRETFKGWTLLLAIITFSLSLIGTFLVRSGVLVSVHAFANDPSRGIFLLIFLAIIMGSAFLLYAARINRFYKKNNFELFSRETLLLVNSVFLITAVGTIVLGTLYPIILDSLNIGKISVGEPYFNTVFIPIMLPLLLVMGMAPHVNWLEHSFLKLIKKLKWNFFISLIIGFMTPALFNLPFHWLASLGIFISAWVTLSTLEYAYHKWKLQTDIQLQQWSMIVAHLGIAVIAMGITINKSYSQEKQVKMHRGESTTLAGYQFKLDSINETQGANFQSIAANFTINYRSEKSKSLSAEQRIYSHEQLLSKSGILFNPWRDLYLSLGTPLPDGSWSVRIYYKPFVRWIWAGGFMLLFGAMLSLLNHYLGRKNEIHG